MKKATSLTVCFVPVLLGGGGEEECSDVVGRLGGGGGGGEGGPVPLSHRQGQVTVQHLPIPSHKEQGFRIFSFFSCLHSSLFSGDELYNVCIPFCGCMQYQRLFCARWCLTCLSSHYIGLFLMSMKKYIPFVLKLDGREITVSDDSLIRGSA
jgi:hypothetical protein